MLDVPLVAMLFALVGALEVGLTLNALRPARGWLVYGSFLASWWVGELALHHILGHTALAIAFVAFGALEHWLGWLGLVCTLLSLVVLAVIAVRSHQHAATIEATVVRELGAPRPGAPRYPRWHFFIPFAAFFRRDVEVERRVDYHTLQGATLRVDVYKPKARASRPEQLRPALIQVHGGAWVVGFKWMQNIPMMTHLAANGWVCFNIDYRLSPHATFPEHLIDIKRAIAWIRDHASDYDVDPGFIAIAGNSAGGHLASLAALTPNDPAYQPGFETYDTSVKACVSIYGLYDLTDRGHPKPTLFHRFLERIVFKTPLERAPERFEEASPVYRVHPDAPPFLIIHGANDGVAVVEDARTFATRLRSSSHQPTHYLEVPGAGHLFDVFPSLRARVVTEAIEGFLWGLHDRYRAGDRALEGAASAGEATILAE